MSTPQREPPIHHPVSPPAAATVHAGLVLRGQAIGRPWPITFPLTQCPPPPDPETLPLALTSSLGAPAKPHMPVWAPP